jgi:glutamate synthase domain-containing protein 2
MGLEWGTQRIVNLYLAWQKQLAAILSRLGMKSVNDLVGRTDLLAHADYTDQPGIEEEWE